MPADVAISGPARRELRQAPATTPEAQKKSEWHHRTVFTRTAQWYVKLLASCHGRSSLL
jgi:hypothetical protein